MGVKDSEKIIKKTIKKSKKIFIMGHKNLDLDAIGSSIGVCSILTKLKKDCYIVIDDVEHEKGVEKVLKEIQDYYEIIKSEEIEELRDKKNSKNLLIIVDTNKYDLVQAPKILDDFDKKIVIDHHELGKKSIDDALMIIDESISSASEMIVDLASLYKIELSPHVCTALLAGIILDTYNFTLKTNANTYYNAYYLTEYGASPKKVQYLLKQDIEDYAERQKLVTDIEVKGKIAISKGTQYVFYRPEDLAKAADTLLFFDGIEASFVVGKTDKDTVRISGRSLGNYNIGKILENLSGGGDTYNGAAVFNDKKISEVYDMLKKAIETRGE